MKKQKSLAFYEPGTIMRFDGNDNEAGAWGFFPVKVVKWDAVLEGHDENGLRVLPKATVQSVKTGRIITTFTFNIRLSE